MTCVSNHLAGLSQNRFEIKLNIWESLQVFPSSRCVSHPARMGFMNRKHHITVPDASVCVPVITLFGDSTMEIPTAVSAEREGNAARLCVPKIPFGYTPPEGDHFCLRFQLMMSRLRLLAVQTTPMDHETPSARCLI